MNGYVTTDFERGMDVGRQVAEAQLKAENATLRTQLADVTESMSRVEERCAKLRELVRDFYPFAVGRAAKPWLAVRRDRMRELGVEADV